MSITTPAEFIPVLTVMVDYGDSPFLWLADSPEQTGVALLAASANRPEDAFPMSDVLWRQFAEWSTEFDRTAFYSDKFNANDWDWPAFHARGFELARRLKEEVGTAYRVVYDKPFEDPNHRIDERTEILANGDLRPLPRCGAHIPDPPCFCKRIVSGGQTGADRGALDFAIKHLYPHGGWAPAGRKAEDGCIPRKYQLTELPAAGYIKRTRRNVEDSDGTLIVTLGDLEGGTLATRKFAERQAKPCLTAQLDAVETTEAARSILDWLRSHTIETLNVAGPRESKCPGIQQKTLALLEAVDALLPKTPAAERMTRITAPIQPHLFAIWRNAGRT